MAGSICPVEVMKRCVSDMHMAEASIAYGMTETSPVSCQTLSDDDLDRRTSTIGKVHPHVEVKIVDPVTGETIERGETGELCTRGYSVMIGYWDEPEKTAESIDEDGWMHTGDLAVMREDGYCNVVGRIKDMVIRGGENIYPREIEEFLYSHPDIEDVQVVGVPDERYGEELCAWVKMRAGADAARRRGGPRVLLREAVALQDPALRDGGRRLPDDGDRQDPQGRDAPGVRGEARARMSELDRLADDYWDSRLRTAPSWAHLIGEYRYADRFDDVSRAGEESAADEARGLRRPGGGDRRGRSRRAAAGHPGDGRLGRDGPRRDARLAHGRVRRRTRSSGCRPRCGSSIPKLAVPDAEVAEAMVGKFEHVAVHLHDLAERHREGVASGRTPADFAVRQTVDQLDDWLGDADQPGPDARRAGPARRAWTPPAGTSGCWPWCRSRCGRPSSTTATCCATRWPRTPGPTSAAV